VTKSISMLINCDLGEKNTMAALRDEEKLYPFIDMVNISCGGHAGGPDQIKTSIQWAMSYGVKIGAHPSFPDRKNFGRTIMELPQNTLTDIIAKQLELFLNISSQQGAHLWHIKAHGALYNMAMYREKEATSILIAMEKTGLQCGILCMPGSKLYELSKQKSYGVWTEGFIDRKYLSDGSLQPRTEAGSLIVDTEAATEQYHLLKDGKVKTSDGREMLLAVETLCIHSDNPNVLSILKRIKAPHYNF
jgi:5-oxoprolinase (ATP-hydrolysing) subunit A